jgi:hypothetical protein
MVLSPYNTPVNVPPLTVIFTILVVVNPGIVTVAGFVPVVWTNPEGKSYLGE